MVAEKRNTPQRRMGYAGGQPPDPRSLSLWVSKGVMTLTRTGLRRSRAGLGYGIATISHSLHMYLNPLQRSHFSMKVFLKVRDDVPV